MIGLPAAGKTSYAAMLAADRPALRLTPDEWMIPLFGESAADGRRDALKGRLIALAVQGLLIGVDVVLDFWVWGRDERTALRVLAAESRCWMSPRLSADRTRRAVAQGQRTVGAGTGIDLPARPERS